MNLLKWLPCVKWLLRVRYVTFDSQIIWGEIYQMNGIPLVVIAKCTGGRLWVIQMYICCKLDGYNFPCFSPTVLLKSWTNAGSRMQPKFSSCFSKCLPFHYVLGKKQVRYVYYCITNLPCVTKRQLKYIIENEKVFVLELKTSAKVDWFFKLHKDKKQAIAFIGFIIYLGN